MTGQKIDILDMFISRLVGMLRFKLTIALVFAGIIAFGVAVETFDPIREPLPTFQSVQQQLEEQARAEQEGRPANTARFQYPFDNFSVTGYLFPLFGLWVLCKLSRWRRRIPMAVFLTLATLWFGLWLAWIGGEALYEMYGSMLEPGSMSERNRVRSWVFVILMALLVPIATFRWLRRGPGWIDRILRGGGAPGRPPGELAAKRARLWLAASVLLSSPLLWWIYDGFDSQATPGPFALGVRAGFVALALWMLTRSQMEAAGLGASPAVERRDDGLAESLPDF